MICRAHVSALSICHLALMGEYKESGFELIVESFSK